MSWLSGVLDYIGGVVGDIGGGIESAASSVGNAVGDAATSVGTGISDVASSIGSGIGDVASELGGMLGVSGGSAAEGAGVGTAVDAVGGSDAFSGAATMQAPPTPGAGVSAASTAMPDSVIGFNSVGSDATQAANGTMPMSTGGGSTALTDTLMGDAKTAPFGSYIEGAAPSAASAVSKGVSAVTPSLSQIGSDISGGNYGQAVSDVGSKLGANANWLLPAGAIGAEMMLGNTPAKGEAQVSQAAGQLGTAGQQLQSYLTTGTLPPGVQSSITSASEAAKAAVRQNYAKNGMSGSSAEMADLQHVDTVAGTQGTQIALQLLQQGVSETQMSAQLYGQLMQSAMSSDQSLVTALSALAGSAARPSVTLNTTG